MVEPQPYAPRMQAEFIHDVEANSPKYMVLVNVAPSWPLQPNSPAGILRWIGPYSQKNYETVGVADITHDGTIYRWDRERGELPAAVALFGPYYSGGKVSAKLQELAHRRD